VGQGADERGGAVEGEGGGRLLDERVVADAAALLVARDLIAVDGGPHALDLGHHALDDGRRKPALEVDELVLVPVRLLHFVEVEAAERALDLVRHHRRRRLAHGTLPGSRTPRFYTTLCYTGSPAAPRSSERATLPSQEAIVEIGRAHVSGRGHPAASLVRCVPSGPPA